MGSLRHGSPTGHFIVLRMISVVFPICMELEGIGKYER